MIRVCGTEGTDQALFRALYPELRRFAAAVGSSDADPDDLVQDALVRVLQGGRFGRLENPGAYLRRTIVNLAADHRRSMGRRARAIARLMRPSAEMASYPSDVADLERLKPIERAILYLTDVERMSHGEAAALLGTSAGAARSRASRARRRLRTQIEQEERR